MAFLLILLLGAASAQLGDWENYNLIWEDQFDFLDLSKWDHEVTAWGGGNNEFEVYTPDTANSYTQNGILHIKPTRLVDNTNPLTGQPFGDEFLNSGVLDLNALYGRCTNGENFGCYREGANNRDIPPIMSGRLRTADRFSFTYGRVRVRAQIPTGDWLWPAIWMLPEDWVYGGWPLSGEIDITESIGNEDYRNADGTWAGMQHMGSTLHWGPSPDQNRYYLTTSSYINETTPYSKAFHYYDLDWSEDGFRFLIDDVEILNVPNPLIPNNPDWTGFYDFGAPYAGQPNPGWNTPTAPFDQSFHFLLNVACGGTNFFFAEDAVNRGGDPQYTKPWSNSQGQREAFNSFYDRQDDWYWTWTKEGDGNHLQVDYIEVYEKIATNKH